MVHKEGAKLGFNSNYVIAERGRQVVIRNR